MQANQDCYKIWYVSINDTTVARIYNDASARENLTVVQMSTFPIGGGGWPPCFFERMCSFTTLIQSKLQQHPQWRIPAGHGLRLQPGLAATAITAYRQASLRLRRWSVCRRGKLASSLAVFGGASAHDLDPARGAMGSALRGATGGGQPGA